MAETLSYHAVRSANAARESVHVIASIVYCFYAAHFDRLIVRLNMCAV